MKTAVISFTNAAADTAERICSRLAGSDLYDNRKCSGGVKSHMAEIFAGYDRIVFVCAAGIAVRLIAPYIEDKTKDPAVVVVDDMGRFAISLLSGHIGGANGLALEISLMIGTRPVITTASDERGIESVDMFAKRCGFVIENMQDAKILTTIMVNGGKIGCISETGDRVHYPNISDTGYEGCIYVTSRTDGSLYRPHCILRPKNLIVGIGCKKGKDRSQIVNAICEVFKDNALSIKSIRSITSIDLKKDEIGIIEASKCLGCKFLVFSRDDVKGVQDRFAKSVFVKSKVGVTSVCEPCVCLAGAKLIVGKACIDGITVAVGRLIN